MSSRPFVHLHCHTHYSLLDGASRVPELVETVKKQGMNAVAITDHGNLYGAIEFYTACRGGGLNPIIGYEAYVAPGKRTERDARRRGDAGFHLTLLAQNETGFRNLIKMASIAFLEGYHYVPRIDKELLEAHSEGLICLSGCASSEFSEYILKDQIAEATRLAEWFHRVFGKNFYVEIQNNGLDIQKICAQAAIDIANRLGLPLVATCDAHYLTRDDALPHDVLLCINTGKTLGDENRMRYGSDQFYVRAPEEMYRLFPEHHEAIKRTQQIADGCDIRLDFKKRHFPVYLPPAGKTPEAYLRELCDAGVRERYGDNPPDAVRTRLEHELGVICRMGFASYFLIVSDFVRFAVERGIPCSARGSACGALVSFVLKLSHVDPLDYDLLFERFLDPNRTEAPDIDIDFCQDRREEVIAYVRQKYGEASVAQIATFGTLAARAAIKDVGRALNFPLARVIQLTEMIPTRLGITLDDALKENGDLRQLYQTDTEVTRLLDIARTLEGTNRQSGIHAAGVVIANGPLTDYVPLHRAVRKGDDAGARSGEAVVATQWVMGDLEKVGMLKMDFLGLRTLTLLENAVRLIKRTRGETIDIYRLPIDDPETYALLQRGDAKGVFQFESDGIRELLKRLRPDNIRDIIACTALYRPGPLGGGMVDAYINCKHGREKPTYAHPVMEEILGETYGVMVYQEEIMRILNRLGGIELASAYACIKAISKKKQEIIDARKADFIKGAQERGLAATIAEEIFGLIVYFGGYGFNKCLVGETEVVDAATGERATLESLYQHRRPFTVHALGDDWRLRPRPVVDVMANGVKPVFEVLTAQGKRIVATDNHPFRTFAGWTLLRDLRVGDLIAAPRQLAVAATETWPAHELIALAGLLSEGNCCHPTTLYFYGNDEALVDDFARAAGRFPDSVAQVYRRPNRRCLEVRVNTGSIAARAARRRAEEGGVATLPARSGMFRWAQELGLLGRKVTQKRIPDALFRLRDDDVALFLGRLWAGDGFIASGDNCVPFYATSSPLLAKDVATLLLRLGILSGVHTKSFKYRDGERTGYTVHLLGDGSIRRFLDRVAPHAVGRESAVDHLRRYLDSVPADLSSKDLIPETVRELVRQEKERSGLTWGQVEHQADVSAKDFAASGTPGKRGFRRSTVARLAEHFQSRPLAELATSDVFWDCIVRITPLGERMTYDLTVEGDHNFVADGLIVHNSHSAAYAFVSYQTAYLKAHYPAEFMAALLSSEIDDGNKRDIMVDHIADARRLGIDVLPPNVNLSESDFTVRDNKIVFGLAAIKGCGRGATDAIVAARAGGGPYRDLFDFCERVDLKAVNRTALERLVKAGAFDCFRTHRAQLMHLLPRALQAATERQNDLRVGQRSLFDAGGDEPATTSADPSAAAASPVEPWPEAEKLKYEKEVLDFYFSSHPLAEQEGQLRRYVTHTVAELKGVPGETEVTVGGMLAQVRVMSYKKPQRNGNTRYGRCKIEDFTGALEAVMWGDEFGKFKDLFIEDQLVLARGLLERKTEQPILQITRLMTLEQAQRELARELHLLFTLGRHSPVDVDVLAGLLRKTPGSCPVILTVRDPAGRRCILKLGRDFAVNPATYDQNALEDLLGTGSVQLR
ncbi:MAG: DNA polymerase III subunit alpha [Gemmataceae bacterium]